MSPPDRDLESLTDRLRAADPPLPELVRARVAARISAQLSAPEARTLVVVVPRGRNLRVTVLGVVAAVLLVGLVATFGPRAHRAGLSVPTGASGAPPSASAPSKGSDVAVRETARNPRDESSRGAPAATPPTTLHARSDAPLRASFGAAGHLAISRAGTVRLLRESADEWVLELERGTLLVDYDGSRGPMLRVRTADSLVTVVGTLFAVQAEPGRGTRVAVAHGTVRVQAASGPIKLLTSGRQYDVAADRSRAAPAPLLATLERHGRRARAARPESAGVVIESDSPSARAGRGPIRRQGLLPGTSLEHAEMTEGEGSETSAAPLPALAEHAVLAAPSAPGDARKSEAHELYAAAEQALASGDRTSAKEHFTAVVRVQPASLLTQMAHYELARIALQERAPAAAQSELQALEALDLAPSLREPIAHLRCRTELAGGHDAAALRCFERFESEFPGSSRRAEVLAVLGSLNERRGGCEAARPWLQRYVTEFPNGPHTPEARRKLDFCAVSRPK